MRLSALQVTCPLCRANRKGADTTREITYIGLENYLRHRLTVNPAIRDQLGRGHDVDAERRSDAGSFFCSDYAQHINNFEGRECGDLAPRACCCTLLTRVLQLHRRYP